MNERRDEREEQIQIIKCITENAQLAGEWTYDDDTRFVGCQFPQGGKNSVCEVQPALGRSTAALGQFLAMTRTGVPLLLAELADLRQQLAEARIASLNCKVAHGTDLENIAAQLREASQRLAEARAERDGFQCQLKAFDKLHWELVDLFDKNAGGVSPLHYVKERIAAQAAELATLRERLAAAEAVAKNPRNSGGDIIMGSGVLIERVKIPHCDMWRAGRRYPGLSYQRLELRDCPILATLDAIAAGWIPPSTKGEG